LLYSLTRYFSTCTAVLLKQIDYCRLLGFFYEQLFCFETRDKDFKK
jgi:hypothetical protein